MILKVVILASAEQDLKDLKAYILKNFSARIWRATYAKLKDAIRNFSVMPLAGAIPDELAQLNLTQYRQIVSGMNRIIYEVRQDTIYLHILVDTRRDLNALLTRRLLRVI